LTAIVSQIINDLRKLNKIGFSITTTGPLVTASSPKPGRKLQSERAFLAGEINHWIKMTEIRGTMLCLK
jgi:hypothetical protein